MPGKDDIENIFDNTYGIEIEFGTHNCEMLSFTHIEVWNLYPASEEYGSVEDRKKIGWKIETDADYTLELVSPILQFDQQTTARKYKTMLMNFLQQTVQKGILLTELTKKIKNFVETGFKYDPTTGFWTYTGSKIIYAELKSEFIGANDLHDSLDWFNWDEDSDLEQVLAAKQILASENGNDYWNNSLNSILLTPSRKHDGLPASQMNIPLSLAQYLIYNIEYKRKKSWERLLVTGNDSECEEIREKMKLQLATAYPELAGIAGDPVWKGKYLNDEYLNKQIEDKMSIWHEYWLWLVTFGRSVDILLSPTPNKLAADYYSLVFGRIDSKKKCNLKNAVKVIETFAKEDNKAMEALISTNPLIYLTLQKLVSGTLGEMSEVQQGDAQKEIMKLKGYWNMEDVLDKPPFEDAPDKAFFPFHSVLKDLTSLWFKAPLIEAINSEKKGQEFCEWFKTLDPSNVSYVLTTVLKANLDLLKWYYGRVKDYEENIDWDWDDFLSENMPSVELFKAEFFKTCVQFHDYLIAPVKPTDVLCTLEQLPQKDVIFLQRKYGEKHIARWEGRWDTMKKPIPNTDPQRYLIEHRNN
jgi:hypothetical protein